MNDERRTRTELLEELKVLRERNEFLQNIKERETKA